MGAMILQGDCRDVLPTLAAGSIHCVVTSPPYFGLRDYKTATWEGGDPSCGHLKVQDGQRAVATSTLAGGKRITGHQQEGYKATCGRCGAVRVDRQIGLEVSPVEYVQAMVEVFRHIWRVLRDDGTAWLNLGDSYSGSGKGAMGDGSAVGGPKQSTNWGTQGGVFRRTVSAGTLKDKDLIGIPWRVAFALQEDGWYLRSDIIWQKPNPMPESVWDRPTKSHEYIFLLAKQRRYFYDTVAIAEPALHVGRLVKATNATTAKNGQKGEYGATAFGFTQHDTEVGATRNKRSVWTVATQPFAGAHFATFPSALIEPCISAGTSAHGCCPKCGAPWKRLVDRQEITRARPDGNARVRNIGGRSDGLTKMPNGVAGVSMETRGWEPTCQCGRDDVVPCVVLDPFAGAGTAPLVAASSGRNAIGIELSPEYCDMARKRLGLLLDEGAERKEAAS